jgi:hypothetical protein
VTCYGGGLWARLDRWNEDGPYIDELFPKKSRKPRPKAGQKMLKCQFFGGLGHS